MLARACRAPVPAVTKLAGASPFNSRHSHPQSTENHLASARLHLAPRSRCPPALEAAASRCCSSYTSETGSSDLFLIIYSKPGCHLCDGLKEKVQAILDKAMFQPSPFSNASLQIRNILDEPEWEAAYGMVIPVLTAIKSGAKEEIKIARPPPRISADRLGDHIAKSLNL